MKKNDFSNQDFIKAAYRVFFERDVDEKALRRWTGLLNAADDPAEFFQEFAGSEEFRQRSFAKLWRTRDSHYRLDNVTDVSPDILARLFEKTSQYWRNAGGDPSEIYFSVVSAPNLREALSEDRRLGFLGSGKAFFDFAKGIFEQFGQTPLSEASCLDFGCGVGRMAVHAARLFDTVVPVDFSQGHIDELKRNVDLVAASAKRKITPVVLSDVTDVETLPKVDYCFSYIVLQHNTPPIMAYMLQNLLRSLKPGGVALIHIPVHHPFYRFDAETYLANPNAGRGMEMHMLPRENIREIAEAEGCPLRDSYGYGGTKGVYSEVFAFQKT